MVSAPQPTHDLGLRERKAAATRAAIVDALWRRLATTSLAEISADDLARDANVSRMTFFNYFPSKDHAVDFLMVRMMGTMAAAIAGRRLRGVAAIEQLFALTGDAVAEAPERMRRVYAYFATRPGTRPMPALTRADRAASGLPPGEEGPPLLLGGMLMAYIEEAQESGELSVPGSSYELAHYLGAVLNGSSMLGSSSPDTDHKRLFRRHARRALGLLGAPGHSDPPPPKTPARYRRERGKR